MTELGERVWIKKTQSQHSLGFQTEIRFKELDPVHYPKSCIQNQAAHFSDYFAVAKVTDLSIKVIK